MTMWYLTRATGATALVLLTMTLVLGIVDVQRLASPRLPRFVIDAWHRTTALLVLVLLGIHIVTTLLDGYAPVKLVDVIVPFVGVYRPLWLGLGALALDLLLALIVTSLLRARLGLRAWRAIHWLAYACWPVALLHALGTGSDVRAGWMAWLGLGCVAAVAAALAARLGSQWRAPVARAGAALAVLGVLGLAVWLPSGPMAKGWAAKAGTPATLLKHTKSTSHR